MSGKTPASKKGTRRPRPLSWAIVSVAARSPETRLALKEAFAKTKDYAQACTMVEDMLEFKAGKTAAEERERIKMVRRRAEG